MITSPLISVVMAVYNGAATLSATLDSILTQEGVDLEFIVINDGSTDHTALILQEYANQDERLKILEQENMGLTRSLIRGCAEAKGEYIARQDAGDISLPGRLQQEQRCLIEQSDVCMVSCGTRFVGPQDEIIQNILQSEKEANEGFNRLNLEEIQGPSHHGSVMFKRSVYETVGGYRCQYLVAQDLDLWIRLNEQGRHIAIQEILYQASLRPSSISSRLRDLQIACAIMILEGARRRRDGRSEEEILDRAAQLSSESNKSDKQGEKADFYYFLGCCLSRKNPAKAQEYFISALKANPLHFKAGLCLLRGILVK